MSTLWRWVSVVAAALALTPSACGGNGNNGTGGNGGQGGSGAETFTDATTGLIWQMVGASGKNWEEANGYCDGLSLAGQSDWRLPTIDELRSIITGCAATATGGSCGVVEGCLSTTPNCRDDTCGGCSAQELPPQGCFWPEEAQGDCGYYWAIDVASDDGTKAWGVGFNGAHVSSLLKTDTGAARCVR